MLAAACGAARVENPVAAPGERPASGENPTAPGTGSSPAPGFTLPDAAPSSTTPVPDGGTCAEETHEARRVPVDLLLLVDVSSSMANPIAGGTQPKWDIARDSLLAFLRDPRSEGLQIGLQFFPLGASCALADFQKLAVDFAELPAVLPPISAALAAQNVRQNFGTPTGAAVAGALEALKARLRAQPDHRAALVLLTDGEPTLCTPLYIDEIAMPVAAARQGMPAVFTYVIGVFTPAELARASNTVERLAMAGGTTAFVLGAGLDLPARLSETLAEVRNVAVSCAFSLPQPRLQVLDYGRVNVHFSGATADEDLPYVRSADRCDPMRGGWYYDVDPATGARPTQVIVCESSCRAFKADPRARVDLRFGCKSLVVQ
jgi:hypothetical protein